MKKNILAVLIASTFLVACGGGGSEDSPQSSKSIQAFDGPVQFADAVYDCGAESGSLGQTDYNGIVSSTSFAINNTPELCEIIITGNNDSIDTDNSKPMPNIRYVIPSGLLAAGAPITASPLTTLIAIQIEADVKAGIPARNIADVATQVVTDLYGEDLINNGVDPLAMARDMEGTIKKLAPAAASLVTATNHIANDLVVYAATATAPLNIESVIATSKAVAEYLIVQEPNYPSTAAGAKYISLPVSAAKQFYDNVEAGVINPTKGIADLLVISDAVVLPKPATGATGATGGS